MDDLAQAKLDSRAMWARGDYPTVAERIQEVGDGIVARVGVAEGETVLDVACGAGNAAIPAAGAGASVTGVDLTPELFEAGRRNAAAAGVEVEWVEGDAEALPFDDASFDIVLSTFGCMFAPRHDVTAREIARVLRPAGRIGLCNWTPEGGVGQFCRTVAGHVPPPPGATPPPLWGTEDHVGTLFAGTGVQPAFDRDQVTWHYESARACADFFAENFGPVITARARLEPEGRWQALYDDLVRMYESLDETPDSDELVWSAQYLVVTGAKAG